jgi:hypothetical protein
MGRAGKATRFVPTQLTNSARPATYPRRSATSYSSGTKAVARMSAQMAGGANRHTDFTSTTSCRSQEAEQTPNPTCGCCAQNTITWKQNVSTARPKLTCIVGMSNQESVQHKITRFTPIAGASNLQLPRHGMDQVQLLLKSVRRSYSTVRDERKTRLPSGAITSTTYSPGSRESCSRNKHNVKFSLKAAPVTVLLRTESAAPRPAI